MKVIFILFLCFFVNLVSAQDFQYRIDSNVNTVKIDSIGKIIRELRNYNTKGNNRYLSYWEAYAYYKCAILSRVLKKEEDAEKFTEKAIEILESTKGKTTEDYALLGMLKNYQINFSGWLATIKLSNQAKTMAQKAIELDGDNLRAYLVLGINNYYTPELYGGKSKCEAYFNRRLGCSSAHRPGTPWRLPMGCRPRGACRACLRRSAAGETDGRRCSPTSP